MKARFLSSDQVEHLLAGGAVPTELDASASRVGRLLSAMRAPASSTGFGIERQTVAAIVDVIRETPRPLAAHRRSPMLRRLRSAKAAAVAATLGALLLGGTAAAAATGALPDPAQTVVSNALAKVGVSVPSPNLHATDNLHRAPQRNVGAPVATSRGKGPDATGTSEYGLCQAWAATRATSAQGQKVASVAFVNLEHAADAAGMSIADYCKGVVPPSGTGETTTTPSTGPRHSPITVRPEPPARHTHTTLGHEPPVSTPGPPVTNPGHTPRQP